MSSNLNLSDHAYQRDLDFDLPVKSKRGSLGFAVDFFFWKAFTNHIISANDQQTISWLRKSILKRTYTKNRIFSENILGTKSTNLPKSALKQTMWTSPGNLTPLKACSLPSISFSPQWIWTECTTKVSLIPFWGPNCTVARWASWNVGVKTKPCPLFVNLTEAGLMLKLVTVNWYIPYTDRLKIKFLNLEFRKTNKKFFNFLYAIWMFMGLCCHPVQLAVIAPQLPGPNSSSGLWPKITNRYKFDSINIFLLTPFIRIRFAN